MISQQENEPELRNQEHLPLPKVYRRWGFLFIIDILQWICICIFSLLCLWYALDMLSPLFNGSRPSIIADAIWLALGISGILGEIASVLSLVRTLRHRLVLTDQGIILHDVVTRQFTPWSNILGIGCQGEEKGLRLKERANCANLAVGLEKNIPTLVVSKRKWWIWDLHAGFFPIPQDISERDWENGLLGRYVRKYSSANMDELVKEELDSDAFLAQMARRGNFLAKYAFKHVKQRD